MRTFVLGLALFVALSAGVAGGWWLLVRANPGAVGTPAHAGAVSNGRPEDCTNVNFGVGPRAEHEERLTLQENWIVRGTFGVEGGLGSVDMIMRIVSPQGLEIMASPKSGNYDFVLPVKLRGDYVFVFDNRYSLYTSKSVGFYYCIDQGRRP